VKAGGVSHDASKVKVYGDGVKPTGVLASLPVSFTVDTIQAGVADVEILIEVCHFYLCLLCNIKLSDSDCLHGLGTAAQRHSVLVFPLSFLV